MIKISEIKFAQHINALGHEIRNRKVEKVASLPSPVVGDVGREVFLTTTNRFYVCNGSAWTLIATDSDALGGQTLAQVRDFSLTTGQRTATSAISDFDTQVRTNRLDQLAIPTVDLNLNSKKITGLANGTGANDAVNKSQLDAVSAIASAAASGVSLKSPVRAAVTTTPTFSGTQTLDGVSLVAGDRVLVAAASVATNGIYVVAAGAWTRATDADGAGELAPGTLVSVTEGTTNGDTLWGLVTDAAITPGTTAHTWAKIINGGGSGFTTAGNGLTSSGATVSVNAGFGIIADGSSTRVDTTKIARRYADYVPAGTSPVTVTHSLGTEDVQVTVIEVSSKDVVYCGVKASGTNTVALDFGTNPTTNQYRVVVVG